MPSHKVNFEVVELYVDGCKRGDKGKIAITDSSGNILLTKLFLNPCCVERLELEALLEGSKFLQNNGGSGTLYSDNVSAIRRFEMLNGKKLIVAKHVRGKNNKADRPSKITRIELDSLAEPIDSCQHFFKAKTLKKEKIRKSKNKREIWKDGYHFVLVRTENGIDQWMTVSKFKRYQKYIRKKKAQALERLRI